MTTYFPIHAPFQPFVDSATYPIALPWRALAALLLFAGISPPHRRALPAHPMTAHSGMSNHSFRAVPHGGLALRNALHLADRRSPLAARHHTIS
jgi:hypothetical protein